MGNANLVGAALRNRLVFDQADYRFHALKIERTENKFHEFSTDRCIVFACCSARNCRTGFLGSGKSLANPRLAWWAHKGSNLGPLPCEGNALPLSYAPGYQVAGTRK